MVARLRGLPLLLVAVLSITAIAAGVYSGQASAEPVSAVEYAEYRNDRWHYSVTVPADMIVSEHEREVGGQTVQLMDATGDKELIVSAWPYAQLDLTLGREGTPSDTSDQPDHLEIVDVVRDDLFTVLFQKNGIRYAVVTLPENESWLTDILKTWEFTD